MNILSNDFDFILLIGGTSLLFFSGLLWLYLRLGFPERDEKKKDQRV